MERVGMITIRQRDKVKIKVMGKFWPWQFERFGRKIRLEFRKPPDIRELRELAVEFRLTDLVLVSEQSMVDDFHQESREGDYRIGFDDERFNPLANGSEQLFEVIDFY